jgi:hypothetical protein
MIRIKLKDGEELIGVHSIEFIGDKLLVEFFNEPNQEINISLVFQIYHDNN